MQNLSQFYCRILNLYYVVPKKLTFWKIESEILEYYWKKIKSKTMFKSISKNRIRKNINFGKHFPKTTFECKIGISEGLEET
jgi:hypothetical protein